FDGQHSLMQVVDSCGQDDLETLTAISKLYFEGLIFNTGRTLEVTPEPVPPSGGIDDEVELGAPEQPEISAARAELDEVVPAHALSALPPPQLSAAGSDASELDPSTTVDYARSSDAQSGAARPRKGKKRRRGDSAMIGTTTLTGLTSNGAPRHDTEEELQAPVPPRAPSDRPGDRRMSVTSMRAVDETRRSTAAMRAVDIPSPRSDDPRKSTAAMRSLDPAALRSGELGPIRPSTTSMRAVEAGGSGPHRLDEELDEDGSPRLMRVRRQRKRKKRLSLTTSPGMLSAVDPATLAEIDDSDDEVLPDTVEMELPEGLKALQKQAPPPAATRPPEPPAAQRKPLLSPNNGSTLRPAAHALLSGMDAPFKSSPSVTPEAAPKPVTVAPNGRAPVEAKPNVRVQPAPAIVESKVEKVGAKPDPRVEVPKPEAKLEPPKRVEPPKPEAKLEPPKPAPPRIEPPKPEPLAKSPEPQAAVPEPALEDWPSMPPAPRRRGWIYGALLLAAGAVFWVMVRQAGEPAPVPQRQHAQPEPNQLRPAPPPGTEPPAELEPVHVPAPEPESPPQPRAEAEQTEQQAAPQPQAEPEPAAPAAEGGGDALDAAAVLEQARKLDEQGKQKQALAVYESAAQRLPRNSVVLGRLAFAYLNLGRNKDAADYAARAVELDPTNSEGWIVLGAGKSELGDRKAGRDAYKKCVELGKGPYVAECKRMVR
ncbi:MAG TPA: tetratricopeptide repeat protein, partial [Polyangiales bacterium]|nr:tetratricopeptide repeat protein [Polyangiales bacterium]